VGEPLRPTLTDSKPARGGRKRGPDLSVLVETTVVGLFGLVAVATAHEHWLKEREDVMAITGPLNAWIDQLPAKTLKKVEKNLAPTLLVVGIATVIGPDAVLEMRLRAQSKNARTPVSGTPTGPRSLGFAPADGPAGRGNGVGVPAGSAGGWHSSVPSAPPIGFDGDV